MSILEKVNFYIADSRVFRYVRNSANTCTIEYNLSSESEKSANLWFTKCIKN